MLLAEALDQLHGKKNLLAFSAGIDSTALYYLLKQEDIPFDIALVNYQTRPQSDAEAHYAQTLAKENGKNAYILTHPLSGSDFEQQARQILYTSL